MTRRMSNSRAAVAAFSPAPSVWAIASSRPPAPAPSRRPAVPEVLMQALLSREGDVQSGGRSQGDAAEQDRGAPPDVAGPEVAAGDRRAVDQPLQVLGSLGRGEEADHDAHQGVGAEGDDSGPEACSQWRTE